MHSHKDTHPTAHNSLSDKTETVAESKSIVKAKSITRALRASRDFGFHPLKAKAKAVPAYVNPMASRMWCVLVLVLVGSPRW